MQKFIVFGVMLSSFYFWGCKAGRDKVAFQKEAQVFLNGYNQEYQKLLAAASETQWVLNTHIVEGDSIAKIASQKAEESFAAFTGSKSVIESARKFLEQQKLLDSLQVRQFHAILFIAGNNPEVAADVVKKRIAKQNAQIETLYGFKFMLDGKEVTPNKLDEILRESKNLKERESAWNASKEVGKPLKSGVLELRGLRNQSVQALGYKNYFDYQASEYGLSSEELRKITQSMIADSWTLYRELHTWARYELAKKYNQPVPEYLPADWLPNRWGQDWTALVSVDGVDIDPFLKKQKPEWITQKGEAFYQSIGFPALPATFWEKSSLYPVPDNAGYKKNTHASAWHMDNDKDVRSLMSVENNTEWWGTTLHELGHIYYYITYSNPDVPIVLRSGANRAYHEALGSMMGLASLQKPFLSGLGMIAPNVVSNDTMMMMKEALDYVVHIPWGSGTMTEFEYQLYAQNLPENKLNAMWWELAKKYQGIVPPRERGEEYCDAATKTHINDDAAQYYDYSMSNVLLFQFHDHIAKNILKQDAHATNYWGNKGVGEFLQKIMYPGASVDWRTHLKASIGSDFSAKPMMDYFEPLNIYLKRINQGRNYTLPEKPIF